MIINKKRNILRVLLNWRIILTTLFLIILSAVIFPFLLAFILTGSLKLALMSIQMFIFFIFLSHFYITLPALFILNLFQSALFNKLLYKRKIIKWIIMILIAEIICFLTSFFVALFLIKGNLFL